MKGKDNYIPRGGTLQVEGGIGMFDAGTSVGMLTGPCCDLSEGATNRMGFADEGFSIQSRADNRNVMGMSSRPASPDYCGCIADFSGGSDPRDARSGSQRTTLNDMA
jgi:hypothetical protein